MAELNQSLEGRYRIERELGQGGMATVYLARDVRHDRLVALKFLRPEVGAILGGDRFAREIRTVARLQHPHLLTVHDSGSVTVGSLQSGVGGNDSPAPGSRLQTLLWFSMPFVDGESLRDRIARDGQLPQDEAVTIAREVADGLAYAHVHGVIHRDIKPENILVSGGHALVADFGIARSDDDTAERLTSTGLAIGTPAYMSPEQASGEREIDARSDVYALGAVLYEMLVGEPPFTGRTAQIIVARSLTETPRPIRATRPAIAPGLERVVHKALARNPVDRFRSMAEFGKALAQPEPAATQPIVTTPVVIEQRRPMLYGVLVAAALIAIGWYLVHTAGVSRKSPVTSTAPSELSIAVLPFGNVSQDSNDLYFSDGMTDELRAVLGNVPGLRVAAHTSSFKFRDSDSSAQFIGGRLGVAYLVEGRTRRQGDQLHVQVELIKTADGLSLWTSSFDQKMGNLIEVQETIAKTVVEKLRLKLAPGSLVTHQSSNLAAHDLYQKGQYFLAKRDPISLAKSVDAFAEATRLDSTYALAYAGLGMARSMVAVFTDIPATVEFPQAWIAISHSLQLDSALAEGHSAAGVIHTFYDRDYDAAEREFATAIALDPSEPSARLFHAWNYLARGLMDSAVAEIKLARDLDKLSSIISVRVGSMLMYAGRNDESLVESLRARDLDPGFRPAHAQLAHTYLELHRCVDALAEVRDLQSLVGWQYEAGSLGQVYGGCNATAEAKAFLQRLLSRAQSGYVSANVIALAYAAMGDKESALQWLEKAEREHDWSLVFMNREATYLPLHDEPRFKRVVELMRLK